MADFVQTSNTKTVVRDLAAPIADVTAFNTIVQGVITGTFLLPGRGQVRSQGLSGSSVIPPTG